MAAYRGMPYLRKKLEQKRRRVLLRYRHYDMKMHVGWLSEIIPPEYSQWAYSLGWCAKAVDTLADRLVFREFRNDNFDLNTIFRMNNADVLYSNGIRAALIASCSFVYITEDITGYPRLEIIDGYDATGVKDVATGLLKEGYAVLARDDNGKVLSEAYFLPHETQYYENGKLVRVDEHASEYPLLVPLVHRPDSARPFGHSRITRACMSIQKAAVRTLLRSEVSSEFYSFPQKYILGLSSDLVDDFNTRAATMSSFLNFTKDEDGDSPTLGQFTQQSMSPFVEQLRMHASLFAGETGLTTDDLGFVTDNPSSAEAIKASHENLRLAARSAQAVFGSGFLNAGYLAACVRDNFPYQRSQLYLTTPVWAPVFEPDAAMLSSIGDGIIKINQAVPGYFGAQNVEDLTGIAPNL